MVRQILLGVVMSMTHLILFAQTQPLNGKVSNEKNEALSGVSILIEGTNKGTTTDLNGNFSLLLQAGKLYSLRFTRVGYAEKLVSGIEVSSAGLNEFNIIMELQAKMSDAVVVKSTARKESVNAMISFQKNTAPVAQVVSAEAIRKSPDPNTGEVLKRVSGIALQEGKYLVVRGLADRYNQTMVNGALMSSTEPDRKTFSYDIFPSSTIENIVVNKTALPELPGEFSGGLVQITTKEIPSKRFLNVSVGTGANLQTTGKPFYTYRGGKTDWLGFNDGSRNLPDGFPRYRSEFVNMTDNEKYAMSRLFSNNWGTRSRVAGLNYAFNVNGGWSRRMNNNSRFGMIYSVNYSNKNTAIKQVRTFQDQTGIVIQSFNDDKYSSTAQLGALANVTYQLNNNHKISFKNMFSNSGTDYTLLRNGQNFDAGNVIRSQELAFRQSTYYTAQLNGDHNLRSSGVQVSWVGGFTALYQGTPDLRRLAYVKGQGEPDSAFRASIQNGLPSLSSGIRFYSDLVDYVYNGAVTASKSFLFREQNQTFKAGYQYQYKDRKFASRPIGVTQFGSTDSLLSLSPDKIFSPQHFGPGMFKMDEINNRNFDYIATGLLQAGFLQMDNQFSQQLRVVWGARMENYSQRLTGADNSNKPVTINSNVTDILPSANITYKASSSSNIRFAASQTIIRPEFRELAPFEFFDFELVAGVKGNETLKRTKISNLDLRYEVYPRPGELITAGVFYKYFDNPIEPFLNQTGPVTFNIGYANAPEAMAFGVEFDLRKKLSRQFTFTSNLSYIYNKVDFGNNSFLARRPMQGQSPYVINLGMEYSTGDKTTATILFNQVGRRIYFVGQNEFPSVWEAPRQLIDLQVSHKLLNDRAELKISSNDLLNARAVFYQDINDNGRFDRSGDFEFRRLRSGTGINLSFTYRFN